MANMGRQLFLDADLFPGKADIHRRKAADQPDAAVFAHCFSRHTDADPSLQCKKTQPKLICILQRSLSRAQPKLCCHGNARLRFQFFSQSRGKVSENFFCHPSMLLYLLFIHVYGCLTDVIPINFPPYICFFAHKKTAPAMQRAVFVSPILSFLI